MRPHRSIRARLTLTYVTLLVGCTAAVLAVSWWVVQRHLDRTLPANYAATVMGELAGQYALAVAGSALLALGIGWAAAGHALAPVRAIARTAARISEQRLDARVRLDPAHPPDELHELADAFDAMLDRVASSVDAQRRFVANASHELRTPLTVIRTEAEVALDDPRATAADLRAALRGAVEGAERTEALLAGLLVLAATTQGTRRDDPVDVAAVGRRALTASGGDRGGWHTALEPAVVRGDAALLERLVGNLVENAVRHGRPGGRPSLEVRAEHGEALVRVTSPGEPIPYALVDRLAEPFQRLSRSGDGSGLGLSIVRAVAEAHGGRLALASPPAGGLVADVRLPLVTGT